MEGTISISTWIDRSKQTVQIKIRRFLKEMSDQGLHFLSFNVHILDELPHCKTKGDCGTYFRSTRLYIFTVRKILLLRVYKSN